MKFINWFWDEFVFTKVGITTGWIWFALLILAAITDLITA